jgi:stage III sporulation protein SpoIIIAA
VLLPELLGFTEELDLLLNVLPAPLQQALKAGELTQLMEVVLDLGRLPEARYLGGRYSNLGHNVVEQEDIDALVAQIGQFSNDNRAGIPRTLHRISAIRNRQGTIIGVTCRVGKVVTGTIEPIRDLIFSGKSILLLGPPGVGKTTKLREIAQLLADEAGKRVMIVDTSNEIAGDGDIPHAAVGRARRMQVQSHELQQAIMIEAVENHTPEVIVVDEIGTQAEAEAARTIAERGVILIATAHGIQLENLIKNPVLSDLIGGIQSVTLGDDEAKRRATQKTVLEREKTPTFDIAIEIRDRNTLAIYPNVAEAIDHLLRGWTIFPEVRKLNASGDLQILQPAMKVLQGKLATEGKTGTEPATPLSHPDDLQTPHYVAPPLGGGLKVFLYAITKSFIEQISQRLDLGSWLQVTGTMHDADAVLALRGQARPGSKVLKFAADYDVPIFYAKTNTMAEIQRVLKEAVLEAADHRDVNFQALWNETTKQWLQTEAGVGKALNSTNSSDDVEQALQETRVAIEQVLQSKAPVELAPKRSYVRRLQHELAERYRLNSVSIGDEPNRRLKLLPPKV